MAEPQPTFAAASGPATGDLFGATFLFSLIVHAVIILGVTFTIAKPAPRLPTLDVTLVNTANRERPKHADFLAQADNSGGGNSDRARRPSQPVSGLLPIPTNGVAPRAVEAGGSPPNPTETIHRITTTAPGKFTVHVDHSHPERDAKAPTPSKADHRRQLTMARLAAEIRAQSEAYAKRPHKKFISANTREYAYAAYMDAWARRVERVGTLHFPAVARIGKPAGNLVLTVGINRNGTIHDIAVIDSSGIPALDKAAIDIVRMAGPFPPIPHTDQPVDQLYITRTYQFLRGGQLKTR